MGLSSAPGLANRFLSTHSNSEKKSYKKKNLHATGEISILWCTNGQPCEFLFTPGKNKTVLGRMANTIPVARVTWLRVRFRFPIRVEKDT